MEMHPILMHGLAWKYSIISASQKDILSHGEACRVRGELKDENAVTVWREIPLLPTVR